jgi:hypothetical protein
MGNDPTPADTRPARDESEFFPTGPGCRGAGDWSEFVSPDTVRTVGDDSELMPPDVAAARPLKP